MSILRNPRDEPGPGPVLRAVLGLLVGIGAGLAVLRLIPDLDSNHIDR